MPLSARRLCAVFLLGGFPALSAGEAHAQAFSLERFDPSPGPSAGAAPVAETAQLPGSRFQPRLMVQGGVSGIGGDGIHPYAGLEGGLLYGGSARWSWDSTETETTSPPSSWPGGPPSR